MAPGLWLSVASNLIVALTFGYVARAILRRQPRGAGRHALLAFALWWALFAAQSAIASLRVGLIAVGYLDADVSETLFQLENLLSVASLWGLGAYVHYLYRGDKRGWTAWALALVVLAGYYAAVVTQHDIVRVYAREWKTGREFATPLAPLEQAALVASYYGILVVCVVAFWVVAARSDDARARRRARSVAWAVGLIAAAGFVGLAVEADTPLGPLVGVLRIVGAFGVLLAYAPTLPASGTHQEAGATPPKPSKTDPASAKR